jgi:hypothetical protein
VNVNVTAAGWLSVNVKVVPIGGLCLPAFPDSRQMRWD